LSTSVSHVIHCIVIYGTVIYSVRRFRCVGKLLPEAAVLGVGRIQPAPTVYHGEIALRQSMTLSLTFDHRLIDGAPAAHFLAHVRELIEKPHMMLGE